jgi:hypothetical protein
MSNSDFIIRPEDAAAMTGYSVYMIRRFAHRGEFAACMPRGKRGGWEIVKPSFEAWWSGLRTRPSQRNRATQRSPNRCRTRERIETTPA